MNLEINDLEQAYLLEILETQFKETMREENRTDALDYRQSLKQKILLIDRLREKLTRLDDTVRTNVAGV